MTEEEKRSFLQKLKENISDFVYRMASANSSRQALKTRGSMEHLLILITMGDLFGEPDLPALLLLTLVTLRRSPQIATWKRRMLLEKDLVDALA